MLHYRKPEWSPNAQDHRLIGFALLAGLEAGTRGILVSVMPLAMYQSYGDARLISAIYLAIGVCSLAGGLMVPFLGRFVPRRWTYTLGVCLYMLSAGIAVTLGTEWIAFAILSNALATVTFTICFNAYVLDNVPKAELGRAESLRLFSTAFGWTVGPFLGVWLFAGWWPAPFLVSAAIALAHLAAFWVLRLGNGRIIARARRPTPNPIAYLGRFFAQPRLIAGWLFAVLRSCGWWVYVVYLPIFAIEYGLGDKIAGIAFSLSNLLLFCMPLLLRWLQRTSIRTGVRVGFLVSGLTFAAAGVVAGLPVASLLLLITGSAFLTLLEICGGLPFLLAVKPSERTEMAAVYASYRDISNIASPTVAWLVLLFAPVPLVFTAVGGGLLGCWALAGRLHPRLGAQRLKVIPTLVPALDEMTGDVRRPMREDEI